VSISIIYLMLDALRWGYEGIDYVAGKLGILEYSVYSVNLLL
jgi:hypothetical protein